MAANGHTRAFRGNGFVVASNVSGYPLTFVIQPSMSVDVTYAGGWQPFTGVILNVAPVYNASHSP